MSDDLNPQDDAQSGESPTENETTEVADTTPKTKGDMTVEKSLDDFKWAYRSKVKLIKRQKEDFLFRLGKQWDVTLAAELEKRKIKPVTDNRIQPNIFLLTGLERQNRTDFKAYPEGEEDSIKAEIATDLFKDAVKRSDFGYKKSDAFEDGVTCGESHLELYLDNSDNLINGEPCWAKLNSDRVFPAPGFKEYDYSDAPFVYKLTPGLTKDELINLYPEKESVLEKITSAKLDFDAILEDGDMTLQTKDYQKANEPDDGQDKGFKDRADVTFDLLERYYKKYVPNAFLADYETGEIKPSDSEDTADAFISDYQNQIKQMQTTYEIQSAAAQQNGQPVPPAPKQRDPERFKKIMRRVPEIWIFAHVNGVEEPLCDERAWFYPKWKSWPIIPYFAHLTSGVSLDHDDQHLLTQGLVYGVKGVQEQHNKSETLKLMHMNSATNSGWLEPEGSWVDPKKTEALGSSPGVNLSYRPDKGKPERIFPMPISQAHADDSESSAEAIKAILGINADLLAQQGGDQSGRAILLRQKQGLLMVQKLFDNLSRTSQICGRFLLTQLGDIYDTETAKKVLGESFLSKNFPVPMMPVPDPSQPAQPGMPPALKQVPAMAGPDGQLQPADPNNPPTYDEQLADLAIAAVLKGDLGQYDVAVGESVASDTMRMANSNEIQDLAAKMPGIIPPDVIVRSSMLDSATKQQVLDSIEKAQAMQAQAMAGGAGAPPMAGKPQPAAA